jgi:DNA-binding MarR family transcriptional regulator
VTSPDTPIARIQHARLAFEVACDREHLRLRSQLGYSGVILDALLHLAHQGQTAQADLASHLGLSPAGASSLLGYLQQRDMIKRATDPASHDRTAELAPHGRSALLIARESTDRAVQRGLAREDAATLANVARLIETMTDAIIDAVLAGPRKPERDWPW